MANTAPGATSNAFIVPKRNAFNPRKIYARVSNIKVIEMADKLANWETTNSSNLQSLVAALNAVLGNCERIGRLLCRQI